MDRFIKVRGKLIAVLIVIIVVLAAAAVYFMRPSGAGEELPKATIEDLLNSQSARTEFRTDMIITPLGKPFMALAGTPVAMYYNADGSSETIPLLVAGHNDETQDEGISRAVEDFIAAYGRNDALMLGRLVEAPDVNFIHKIDGEDCKVNTLVLAETVWKQSDGALYSIRANRYK